MVSKWSVETSSNSISKSSNIDDGILISKANRRHHKNDNNNSSVVVMMACQSESHFAVMRSAVSIVSKSSLKSTLWDIWKITRGMSAYRRPSSVYMYDVRRTRHRVVSGCCIVAGTRYTYTHTRNHHFANEIFIRYFSLDSFTIPNLIYRF